jgi:hypothetical protein
MPDFHQNQIQCHSENTRLRRKLLKGGSPLSKGMLEPTWTGVARRRVVFSASPK